MADYEQFNYPVTVKRTGRRKTVAIRIVEGSVQLTVPMRLSDKRITSLLIQKENWVRTKLAQDAEKPILQARAFDSGEVFPYLGKNYRLELSAGACGEVQLRHGCLRLTVPEKLQDEPREKFIRNKLALWYREKATGWLDVKTREFSGQLGVQPDRVEVKYFKSRWGSCSLNGTIKYNWRIIMSPHRVIDYLVVHELAHLVHHNHSPDYWRMVENCLPNYRELRHWLKENGASLSLDLTQHRNV